jgi:hypothetical protein
MPPRRHAPQAGAAASEGPPEGVLRLSSGLDQLAKARAGQAGRRFQADWRAFTVAERRQLLRDISPYMPEASSQEYIIVDGKTEDVHGTCRLMPELTLAHLAPRSFSSSSGMRRLALKTWSLMTCR